MQVLTQSQIEKQNELLRHLKIAQFINCNECSGRGWLATELQDVQVICENCNGSGRIYFDQQPWTFAGWWEALPRYKQVNYLTMGAFSALLLLVLCFIALVDKIWP